MIETMNDLIGIAFLAVVILILSIFMYKVLLAHHLIKLDKLEQDYYDLSDDDSYITKDNE